MVLNIRGKRLIEAILVWCYFLLFVFRAIIIHSNSTNGWLVAFGLVEYSHLPDHMKSILVGLPKRNWSDFISKYVRLVVSTGSLVSDSYRCLRSKTFLEVQLGLATHGRAGAASRFHRHRPGMARRVWTAATGVRLSCRYDRYERLRGTLRNSHENMISIWWHS